MLKKEQFWNLIGCILGVVILILGIVFWRNPPDSYSTVSTDYASFGGDYYTYEYDATRAAASNAAVTANNLREVGRAQARYAGALFVVLGALTVVSYGKKYFTYVKSEDLPETDEALDDGLVFTVEEEQAED